MAQPPKGKANSLQLKATCTSPGAYPTSNVYNHKTKLYYWYEWFQFAVLQSSLHQEWAHWRCATLGGKTFSYSTTAALETWPMPDEAGVDAITHADTIGEKYHKLRDAIMSSVDEGLTGVYNLFHNQDVADSQVQQLRQLHTELDYAVLGLYGWNNVELSHDFHNTKQGVRYTICEAARCEVLKRLVQLNHQRHQQEVSLGLHSRGAASGTGKSRRKKVVTGPMLPFCDDDEDGG